MHDKRSHAEPSAPNRVLRRKRLYRAARDAVVQEPNLCEGRNRRLVHELQPSPTTLEPEQPHASAVRSKHLNKKPGASHFLGIFGPMTPGRSDYRVEANGGL